MPIAYFYKLIRYPYQKVNRLITMQFRVLTTLILTAIENFVGKGDQHFLIFRQCFLSYHRQKSSFKQHQICRLQMFFHFDQFKIL